MYYGKSGNYQKIKIKTMPYLILDFSSVIKDEEPKEKHIFFKC